MSFPIGTRVRLKEDISIFNIGTFKKGLEGIVVYRSIGAADTTAFIGVVNLDERHEDLDAWDNELQIFHPEYGEINWCHFEKIA